MVASVEKNKVTSGALRLAVSGVLLSVVLGGCSSVPDAVNPVSWYEKTTDFFAGDDQAAAVPTANGQNGGLSADPNAPAPAPMTTPSQSVANAGSGLNSDQVDGNYASAPIARQQAATSVLQPAPPKTEVASNVPPAPTAVPVAPVTSVAVAQTAPAPVLAPVESAQGAAPAQPMSFDDAPQLTFNSPVANPAASVGTGEFETVVITGDGIDTLAVPAQSERRLQVTAQSPALVASGAQFPNLNLSTNAQVAQSSQVNLRGMTRVATIHFANNSSNLDNRDRSILEAVIQLQKERGGRVVVVGHASARTRDMDYIQHKMVNLEISLERATTIGSALQGQGLEAAQLDVQAVSDTQPLYLEVMPAGEVGNRRVEIYLAPIG